MSDLTAFPAGSSSVKLGLTTNDGNVRKLEKKFRDTSLPASPEDGQDAALDDSSGEDKVYYRDGQAAAWVPYVLHRLVQNLLCNLKQLVGALFEKLSSGSLPTPAAGQEARAIYDTTKARPLVVRSADFLYPSYVLLSAAGASTTEIDVPVSLSPDDVDGPATNPSRVTKNGVNGWLFSATGQQLLLTARVPAGWDGTSDLILELRQALNQAESAADAADWTCAWNAVTLDNDEVTSKTRTSAADPQTSIGSNTSDGAVFVSEIVIDHDDATNPVAPGDELTFLLERTDLAEIGGIVLFKARLRVKAANVEA